MKINLGKILLYSAATFQATQYARAGEFLDGGVTTFHLGSIDIPLGSLAGLFAGVVVNFSLAYAATKLPALEAKAEKMTVKKNISERAKTARQREYIKARNTARYTRIAFYVLLALSPLLVAPANYLSMNSAILGGIPILKSIWALGWSSAMDLSIAMVGLIDDKLIALAPSAQVANQTAQATERPAQNGSAKKSGRSKSHSDSQADIPCRYAGAGCEKVGTQNAMNAHAPHCKFKPTISMPVEEAKTKESVK